jgi:hypothetical protein
MQRRALFGAVAGQRIIALAHESGLAYSISVLLNSFRGKGLADKLKAQYTKGRRFTGMLTD